MGFVRSALAAVFIFFAATAGAGSLDGIYVGDLVPSENRGRCESKLKVTLLVANDQAQLRIVGATYTGIGDYTAIGNVDSSGKLMLDLAKEFAASAYRLTATEFTWSFSRNSCDFTARAKKQV